MLHAVGIQLGICNLKIDHRVNLHGDVVLCNHGLRSEIRHLLLQGHFFRDPLNKGNFHMQAHVPHAAERTQALHHIGPGLLDDDDVADDQRQHQDCQDYQDDSQDWHDTTSVFSDSVTRSLTPSMDFT